MLELLVIAWAAGVAIYAYDLRRRFRRGPEYAVCLAVVIAAWPIVILTAALGRLKTWVL